MSIFARMGVGYETEQNNYLVVRVLTTLPTMHSIALNAPSFVYRDTAKD
jgi:hypothetical protein